MKIQTSHFKVVTSIFALSLSLSLGMGSAAQAAQTGAPPAARAPLRGAARAPAAVPPVPPTMHMLMEKTFLKVRVLILDVFLDPQADQSVRSMALGQSWSEPLAEKMSKSVFDSSAITFRTRFFRDISYARFLSGAIRNEECAEKAGLVDRAERERVEQGMPHWFSAIEERGLRESDSLVYVIKGDSLHVTLKSKDDEILVDQVDEGVPARRSVVASYFAPCSEFREPLLRSLF